MSEDLERRRRSDEAMARTRRQAGEQLLRNRQALAEAYPENRSPSLVGKIWNSPNTALGLLYGGIGHVAGELNRLRPGDQADPRIQLGHNAVEFVNNPAGGVSAITLGNTTIYSEEPRLQKHEEQHTYQGEQLGPLYLPSNLAGGLRALFHDRDENGRPDWHGRHNWNERGPQQPVPTPWSRRAPPK